MLSTYYTRKTIGENVLFAPQIDERFRRFVDFLARRCCARGRSSYASRKRRVFRQIQKADGVGGYLSEYRFSRSSNVPTTHELLLLFPLSPCFRPSCFVNFGPT